MMRISHWIVAKLAPGTDRGKDIQARARVGLVEGWSSVIVNILLAGFKMILAVLSGSLAVAADAIHTLTDALTSFVVVLGFTLAKRPPDEQHPYGHARIESITAVVISVLLGVAAFEVLKEAAGRLLHPEPVRAEIWIIAALIGTIVLKEFQARFSHDLGDLIESEALHADAWHHRTDAVSTGLVVIAIVAARWGLVRLDGAMGLAVAGLIAWAAVKTMREAAGPLLGQRPSAHMATEIADIARSVPGVQGVHDIMVHCYGTTTIVSLHIEVSDTQSPIHLHEMSDEIEETIARRFPGHAVVHVDPLNLEHAHYDEVKRIVADALEGEAAVTSFHDLRLLGGTERFKAVFDVTAEPGVSEGRINRARHDVERRLSKRFPRARVVMSVEPPYFKEAPETGGD